MLAGIPEALGGALLQIALERAIDAILETPGAKSAPESSPLGRFSDSPIRFLAAPDQVRNALQDHITELQRWTKTVSFNGLSQRKAVSQVFVELDAYLVPLREQIEPPSAKAVFDPEEETGGKSPQRANTEPLLSALCNRNEHSVLLGQAGAGKTTSMQKICIDYFRTGKVLLNYGFPIFIRLRDVGASSGPLGPLLTAIHTALGIRIDRTFDASKLDPAKPSRWKEADATQAATRSLCQYLEQLGAALLLDGFDEIQDTRVQAAVLDEVRVLVSSFRKSRVVLTSRGADFPFALPSTAKFELAPLSAEQISSFASRWFQDAGKASDFVAKVIGSPFADTAIRPLTVAHLCAVYERTGDIPEKPKSVYRRVVNLLLEDWDIERSVKRPSKYANFEPDRKFDFLCNLAFELTALHKATRFGPNVLRDVFVKISAEFGLPTRDAAQVVREIEAHSGLIIESGNRLYEFAHKSIHEFLAAEHLVRLPNPFDYRKTFFEMPNELALAVTLSSHSTRFFEYLALKLFDYNTLPKTFLPVYCTRLALEKVDLSSSMLSALAACTLLERLPEPKNHFELFEQILRGTYPEILSPYFTPSAEQDKAGMLMKRQDLPGYMLPKTINIGLHAHAHFTS